MKQNKVLLKSYLGCEKRSVLGQNPCSSTLEHERSIRRVQSRIFQARVQGKVKDVHALQEQLCDSFCAKLLATDYAIKSTERSRVNKGQSLILLPCVKPGLRTNWRISIAKSLWSDNGQTWFSDQLNQQVTCKNTCLSAKEKSFSKVQGQTQQFQSRHSCLKTCLKVKKGKKDQSSTSLKKSIEGKICQTAQQIHALLSLEPEWQAVFVLEQNYQSKEEVVNDLPQCIPQLPQLLRSQSNDCISVKPESALKQIREHLEEAFPKSVVTASIKEWLHTIDHQALTDQLDTFPRMQKRIHGWLKAGILQPSQIALQGAKTPFNDTCSRTSHANFWRTPVFRQESKSVNIFSQAGSSSPYPRYSLYSVFPETLWKELDRVYNVMQIESHNQVKEHVISSFLTRIVLHGLCKQVQCYADNCLSIRSKHKALCLRQGAVDYKTSLLQNEVLQRTSLTKKPGFVCLKCTKHKFADKQFTRRKKGWANPTLNDPCFVKNRQSFLCSGHEGNLVMICSDKELLEACVSRIKDYLLQITRVDHKLSVQQSQQKHDKPETREVKFTDFRCQKETDKANLLSVDDFSCNFFASENRFGLDYLFSKVQDCRQGFLFLGFQVIQIRQRNRYVCTVTPSSKSVRDLMLLIKTKIRQSRSVSTGVWIKRLNPLLLRWVEYYKHCEYKSSYKQISYLIWEKSRTWLARRKRKKT